jgi:hypothetical protein
MMSAVPSSGRSELVADEATATTAVHTGSSESDWAGWVALILRKAKATARMRARADPVVLAPRRSTRSRPFFYAKPSRRLRESFTKRLHTHAREVKGEPFGTNSPVNADFASPLTDSNRRPPPYHVAPRGNTHKE